MTNIFSKIRFIPEEFIPLSIFKEAYRLCKDIDESDTPFVALALFLGAKLLTGDKRLAKGLRNENFDKILTINEIEKFFNIAIIRKG